MSLSFPRRALFILSLAAGPILNSSSTLAAQVRVEQNDQGHWRLRVDDNDYLVKGVDYRVSKIGESPDYGTHRDWALYDFNHNGKNDPAFDAWVDLNRNNNQDAGEEAVGDFELLRRMGANTIRWYVNDFPDQKANKDLLRQLFHDYGIRVAVGNKFGAYTIDSGALWAAGTDYRDRSQRKMMLKSVARMVKEHKDEPYTLLWLIGNENNLRFTNTNASRFPETYAKFLNEAAVLIHSIDGKHPVALVNGDLSLLEIYAKHCPDIDIFGVNAYRGAGGFGKLWSQVRQAWNKPVLVTEYGGSYAPGFDENRQSDYHSGNWVDILQNSYGRKGLGNSIGGFAFEWLDEWWKAGDPNSHAMRGTAGRVGVDNPKASQEYCGIASQGDGKQSPFLRQLRKVYYTYQDLWNEL